MSRPNILLIVSEDHGPHLGCYGYDWVQTPALDALAAEGVLFERHYTTQAVCSPGRAGIHTGRYSHQNGQIGLATHGYRLFPPELPRVLPRLLADAGYRTGLIGKLHINPPEAFPFDLDWNDTSVMGFRHRDIHATADLAGRFMAGEAGSSTAAGEAPFFLQVSYSDAHLPFLDQSAGEPTRPLTGADMAAMPFGGVDSPRLRGQLAGYVNCLHRLDAAVGLLLQRLEAAGHRDDTIVVFTTDHGQQFSRGKSCCYEYGVHVPLIVRWPGRAAAGTRSAALTSHVDLAPTLLAGAGLDTPAEMAGGDLDPLLQRPAEMPSAWRSHVVTEWLCGHPPTWYPQRAVGDGRFKLITTLFPDRPSPIAAQYALGNSFWEPGARSDEIATASPEVRQAYATFANPPAVELYDLDADPHELTNLAGAGELAATQAGLEAALRAWQQQTADPLADPALLERLDREQRRVLQQQYGAPDQPRATQETWQYPSYLREQV